MATPTVVKFGNLGDTGLRDGNSKARVSTLEYSADSALCEGTMSKKQKNNQELPPAKPKINLVSIKSKSEVNSQPAVVELPETPPAQPETTPEEVETKPEASSTEPHKVRPPKPVRRQSPAADLSHLPENPEALFQAIGVIAGDVSFSGKEASITVEGKSYRLYYASRNKRVLEFLRMQVKHSEQPRQRLLVYPRVTHYPKRDQPPSVSFQVVGFDGVSGKGLTPGLQDGEFKLSGLWQFIPVCQTPCITVQKNFTQERLAHIKESDALKRANFMKASHVPLLWRDAPVRPFRFNPKLDKEHQGKALFVEIRAKFRPDKDTWEFSQLCSRPSEPPQFLKLGKKDKAEALKMKKEKQTRES